MPALTMPGMVTINTSEVLTRIGLTETISHFPLNIVVNDIKIRYGIENILCHLNIEEICDYLLDRGINIEM